MFDNLTQPIDNQHSKIAITTETNQNVCEMKISLLVKVGDKVEGERR